VPDTIVAWPQSKVLDSCNREGSRNRGESAQRGRAQLGTVYQKTRRIVTILARSARFQSKPRGRAEVVKWKIKRRFHRECPTKTSEKSRHIQKNHQKKHLKSLKKSAKSAARGQKGREKGPCSAQKGRRKAVSLPAGGNLTRQKRRGGTRGSRLKSP